MMSVQDNLTHELDIDDIPVNPGSNPSLDAVIASRRQLLKGSLGLALGSFMAPALTACATGSPSRHNSQLSLGGKIGFLSVPPQFAMDFDRVIVPPGYTARAFFSWGDAVMASAAPWRDDGNNSWQEQELQAGQNHDGMAYFPFADSPNDHGLLVINHEYTNPSLHPHGPTETLDVNGVIQRPAAEVKKEQAAHGISIIEIRRDSQGEWQRVMPSRFNRRLTANSIMTLSGPLAGSDYLKTVADPTGTRVAGTINNCAMGVTPWGTYLTCEENWSNYFVNRDVQDHAQRASHFRYGIATGKNSHKYYWSSVDPRFDATPNNQQAFGGYVNEPNRFGWVVEIDPFNPASIPKKRTAMGRFARECATLSMDDDGRMAFYSGDDTRGEYIYKFVPARRFNSQDLTANQDLLDEGILYVAVFAADGSGEWRPLVQGQGGLTPRNGFFTQADVLVNTRGAADILGATPMDRPEWVAVHPRTREAYVTLTNNVQRGVKKDQPVDAANPRAVNHHGQILRWREQDDNPAATTFDWEIFLLAGKSEAKTTPDNEQGTINGDLFSCPDGLWFDHQGRLWIETDYDDEEAVYQSMGTNQLLCADPQTREVRRFLVGPRGCEITGLTATPDGKSLWLNVQHPGISYPASDGKTRPRSTTVLITKDDGGVIGN
jgi:secreted PhoX family phosphatase